MSTAAIIIIALAVLVVVIGGALFAQRRRSQQMRARYGAEYVAAVDELGDHRKAEAELRRREKRVESFDVRPLTQEEIDRYARRWRTVQADFVDDPGAAIAQADELIGEAMHARGYPVTDFEQRAADLSVEHPKLVSDYRIAHEVALRHRRGEAGTEDLRRAMLHYRDLFAEVVELPQPSRPAPEPRSFAEEPDHEQSARARDETRRERRADDRAARERRPNDRSGRGGAPLV
jgi:hypothetical protein